MTRSLGLPTAPGVLSSKREVEPFASERLPSIVSVPGELPGDRTAPDCSVTVEAPPEPIVPLPASVAPLLTTTEPPSLLATTSLPPETAVLPVKAEPSPESIVVPLSCLMLPLPRSAATKSRSDPSGRPVWLKTMVPVPRAKRIWSASNVPAVAAAAPDAAPMLRVPLAVATPAIPTKSATPPA
ncbi:hypothetical protein [Mesorhizobium amorphae]|uniref:hypothetical protein n=1 Tax=Mesorhizobium amorphae TaxID=71433 RepID=UPI001185EDA6|nr:hypothetical protein [Mesorhizobium amorphae]